MNRFDYIAYNDTAKKHQDHFKTKFVELAADVESILGTGRAQSLILTKLEEAYMWAGKAIRDKQIANNGTAELQEQRSNS